MLGSQSIRFLGLPVQRAAEEMLEFPEPMKGESHTCLLSPLLAASCCFCSHFSTSASVADASPRNWGTSKAGDLEESFLQPWCVQVSVLPCQDNGILPALRREHGLFGQEGACCAFQPYFSMSFMHRWVWGCTSVPPYLPCPQRCLQHLPNSPVDVTLWMDKENLM